MPGASDNCSATANSKPYASIDDGFGNDCGADLDGDATVGWADLGSFIAGYRGQDPDADLNGDGWVNVLDIGRLLTLYGKGVGPSGLRP